MELKTCKAQAPFLWDVGLAAMAHLASWALIQTIYEPIRILSGKTRSAAAKQQPGYEFWSNSSPSTALLSWMCVQNGLQQDSSATVNSMLRWGEHKLRTQKKCFRTDCNSPLCGQAYQGKPSSWQAAWHASVRDGFAVCEQKLQAGCVSKKQDHKQWQTIYVAGTAADRRACLTCVRSEWEKSLVSFYCLWLYPWIWFKKHIDTYTNIYI